jgi:hypothetical protein
MVNEQAISTNAQNEQTTVTGVQNKPTSYIITGLFVATVSPWLLDLPWQYERIVTNTVILTNQTL